MILLLALLADQSMNYSLKDVLFGQYALHILDKVVSFVDIVILKMIDDQVKAGLRNHINQRRQHLKSVFATTENDQVMP